MKRLIKYIVLYIAYIFLLCYCFDKYLTDVYAYYGFINQMTTESVLISILLLVFLFGFIVKQTTDSYSKLVIYVLVLVNFIPSIITYMFMPISNKYIFLQTTYWFMMILFINIFNKIYLKTKEVKLKNNIISIYIFVLIEFFVVAIVLF